LAQNKGKYYVLLTIPTELRQHFNGRKQLKRSTGTSDLRDAKRRQHGIATELYGQLDACKPDIRDILSDLLGYIGEADEVQRLEDEGHLEGLIQYNKNLEYGEEPENDLATDVVNEQGAKALEVYREWRAKTAKGPVASEAVLLSVAAREYLETDPYGPAKTTRDCELSLSQFQDFTGDMVLNDVTAVMIHQYAEHLGATKSRKTIAKKISYVKRLQHEAIFIGVVGGLEATTGHRIATITDAQNEAAEWLLQELADTLEVPLEITDQTVNWSASRNLQSKDIGRSIRAEALDILYSQMTDEELARSDYRATA
jgi:hypothetical protein